MQLKSLLRPTLFPFLRVRSHHAGGSRRPAVPGRARPTGRTSEFSKTRRLPADA